MARVSSHWQSGESPGLVRNAGQRLAAAWGDPPTSMSPPTTLNPEPPARTAADPAEPPPHPADPAWDEAFLRVQSYLQAHGLESPVLLNQITSGIIRQARAQAGAAGQGAAPVTLAMAVTQVWIGEWFARAGQNLDWTNERMRAQGRLALIFADLPGRWANHFLSQEPPPAELVAAMASSQLLPGPELRLSNMPPAPLEFGFSESGDPLLVRAKMWLPLRAMVSWLIIVGIFGVAWAAGH
jgi:hypothetical protein